MGWDDQQTEPWHWCASFLLVFTCVVPPAPLPCCLTQHKKYHVSYLCAFFFFFYFHCILYMVSCNELRSDHYHRFFQPTSSTSNTSASSPQLSPVHGIPLSPVHATLHRSPVSSLVPTPHGSPVSSPMLPTPENINVQQMADVRKVEDDGYVEDVEDNGNDPFGIWLDIFIFSTVSCHPSTSCPSFG